MKKRYTEQPGIFQYNQASYSVCGKPVKYVKNVKFLYENNFSVRKIKEVLYTKNLFKALKEVYRELRLITQEKRFFFQRTVPNTLINDTVSITRNIWVPIR